MPDSVPVFIPGGALTCHAPAAVTGKRFVARSAAPTGGNPTVATAGAGVRVLGVAAQDTEAGNKVGVWAQPGMIIRMTCGAAVAAGALVESDATGRAITRAAGIVCGENIGAATTAADQEIWVLFRPASL